MQGELASEHPELPIQLLGVNEEGHESGNDTATDSVDLPWLQDVDIDADGDSDTWLDWGVKLRDFVIVDKNNVELIRLNLTTDSLAIAENYDRVKNMLIDASFFTFRGDVNRDGFLNLLDVEPMVNVLTSGSFQFEGDVNQDGTVNLQDVQPFVDLLTGN